MEVLDKSPLHHFSAGSLSFLDYRKMFIANAFIKRLKQSMKIIVQVGDLKESETDKIKHQYTQFIHMCLFKFKLQYS